MQLRRPAAALALAVLSALGLTSADATTAPACPPRASTLTGVYHPSRLTVLNACQRASGVVTKVRPIEEDGDLHIVLQLTGTARKLLAPGNTKQGGLVVELMPRDGGYLPAPKVGDRVRSSGPGLTTPSTAGTRSTPSSR